MASVAETRKGFEPGFEQEREHGAPARGALILVALLLGVLIAAGAQATTVSVELPGLTGALPQPGTLQILPGGVGADHAVAISLGSSASFDLETTFSSISEVSLRLVGHTECPEGGCSPAPHVGADIVGTEGLVGAPGPGGRGGSGGASSVILSGPLAGEFEITLSLPAVQGLEDGQGRIGTAFEYPVPIGTTLPLEGPALVITSARLTVVGDPLGDGSAPPLGVPEPSELALAGVALGAFRLRRRARRRTAS